MTSYIAKQLVLNNWINKLKYVLKSGHSETIKTQRYQERELPSFINEL